MNVKEAEYVLGVSEPYDENDVRLAFNRAVKLAHPDTGGEGEGAAENIRKAMRARTALIAHLSASSVDSLCGTCKGTGSVRAGFGSAVCIRCKGTGKGA